MKKEGEMNFDETPKTAKGLCFTSFKKEEKKIKNAHVVLDLMQAI